MAGDAGKMNAAGAALLAGEHGRRMRVSLFLAIGLYLPLLGAALWRIPLTALLLPAVWNAVLVGWELTYYIGEIPFWLNAVYVAAGEAAVLLVLGTALYFALGSRLLQERLFPQGV